MDSDKKPVEVDAIVRWKTRPRNMRHYKNRYRVLEVNERGRVMMLLDDEEVNQAVANIEIENLEVVE
jgi:hypothetical protein